MRENLAEDPDWLRKEHVRFTRAADDERLAELRDVLIPELEAKRAAAKFEALPTEERLWARRRRETRGRGAGGGVRRGPAAELRRTSGTARTSDRRGRFDGRRAPAASRVRAGGFGDRGAVERRRVGAGSEPLRDPSALALGPREGRGR